MLRFLRAEAAHLYEVRQENSRFKLYLKKKQGFRFKKSFDVYEHAVEFAIVYLRHCCLPCRKRGHVHKVRGLGGVWKARARQGAALACPECGAEHQVFSTIELAARME